MPGIPKFLFFVLFALLFYHSGSGQTCCTGGAPLVGSLTIAELDTASFGLSLSYDFNKIEDFYQEDRKLDDNYIQRSTKTLFAQLDYSHNGRASVSLLLPYVWLTEQISQNNGNQNHSNANIGDIVVMAQYKIVKSNSSNLTTGFGIKLPSGETQTRDNEDQFILVPTLQAGTGSTDYLFLIQGSKRTPFRNTLVISQSFYYKINGSSAKFASVESYKFANEFQSITSFTDQLVIGRVINYPAVLLKVRNTSKDLVNNHVNENTGGTWIYLGSSWTVQVAPKWAISLMVDLPVLRRLNGFQITTTRRGRISLNVKI